MKIGIIYNIAEKVLRGQAQDIESDSEMRLIPEMISTELSALGHSPALIYADWNLVSNCRRADVDLALNIAEGFEKCNAYEHLVPCLLEHGQIPYTGADPTSMLLVRDKAMTKRIIEGLGIKTPKWILASENMGFDISSLQFPLILKPVREEASIGIGYDSVVTNLKICMKRLEYLFQQYGQPVLVEEFIVGREISIGVWGNEALTALAPCEFTFQDANVLRQFRSFEYKWLGGHEQMRNPVDITYAIVDELKRISISAHSALTCRDYSRCDFRLTAQNEIFFLEQNFNPGIGPNSHGLSNTFTRMSEYSGYSYGEMLAQLLSICKQRYKIL